MIGLQLQSPFLAVTSAVDGDVLSVLGRAPEQWFSILQLSLMVPDRSYAGIRLSVVRLVEQGIIKVRSAGRRESYCFNASHLVAPAIISIAQAYDRFLQQLREQANNMLPEDVSWSALFGSAARGQMSPDSDIDLFVLAQRETDAVHDRLEELSVKVRAWTGNECNPLIVSVENLHTWGDASVYGEISRDAITISGERSEFDRLRIP